MSYLRGEYYTWVGSSCPEDCPNFPRPGVYRCPEHDYIWLPTNDRNTMPLWVFDLLVAMRGAELIEEGRIHEVAEEALRQAAGNFGSYPLARLFGRDPIKELNDYLAQITENPPPKEPTPTT